MSALRRCGSGDCTNTFPHTNGGKQYCSRKCETVGPGLATPCTHSTIGRMFYVRCIHCGSDHLNRRATTAEHRNPATHRAEIIACTKCGLEMLLAVDLTRIKPDTTTTRKTA